MHTINSEYKIACDLMKKQRDHGLEKKEQDSLFRLLKKFSGGISLEYNLIVAELDRVEALVKMLKYRIEFLIEREKITTKEER